jgi:hypothetical protein
MTHSGVGLHEYFRLSTYDWGRSLDRNYARRTIVCPARRHLVSYLTAAYEIFVRLDQA